jgi:hypothetical protein
LLLHLGPEVVEFVEGIGHWGQVRLGSVKVQKRVRSCRVGGAGLLLEHGEARGHWGAAGGGAGDSPGVGIDAAGGD